MRRKESYTAHLHQKRGELAFLYSRVSRNDNAQTLWKTKCLMEPCECVDVICSLPIEMVFPRALWCLTSGRENFRLWSFMLFCKCLLLRIFSYFIMESFSRCRKNSFSRPYELRGKANSLCVAIAKFKEVNIKIWIDLPKIKTNSYKYYCINGCWIATQLSGTMGTFLDPRMAWVGWVTGWRKTQCILWISWCAVEIMLEIWSGDIEQKTNSSQKSCGRSPP